MTGSAKPHTTCSCYFSDLLCSHSLCSRRAGPLTVHPAGRGSHLQAFSLLSFHQEKPFAQIAIQMEESFGPRTENNSLKGPLLNHLTLEKTKHNFSSTLMLQASCIYLGLITPCPDTYYPLHPPGRIITPCPTASVISTKEHSKYPT